MRATLSKAPPPPVRLTLAKAAFLIDVCIGLDRKYGSDPLPASDRQKRLLARYGYLADGLTREGASRVISHIHAVERGASMTTTMDDQHNRLDGVVDRLCNALSDRQEGIARSEKALDDPFDREARILAHAARVWSSSEFRRELRRNPEDYRFTGTAAEVANEFKKAASRSTWPRANLERQGRGAA